MALVLQARAALAAPPVRQDLTTHVGPPILCGRLGGVSEVQNRTIPQSAVRPYKVEDLLTLAREGCLRIPAFQRPPRWRSEHVIDLFDSMVHGFPVGTLLFAQRKEPAAMVTLGRFTVDAPGMHDALVVVDGQQRVSALVGALLHPSEAPRGDIHAIWYDLEAQQFYRPQSTPELTCVPVRVLGDSKITLRWLRAWSLGDEREDLVERALTVGKRLREFPLSCAVVPGDDEARLRRMFQRLNTAGVAMREDDVFRALFGHDSATDLKAAAVRVASIGFGVPGEKDVRQCLLCVGGFEPREDSSRLNASDIHSLLPRTEQAMMAALAFLERDAAIPRLELLPYRVPLRVLARFFDVHPAPSDRARTLLKRWVWRGGLSGFFATSSEARVRALQKAVEPGSSDEQSAQALLRQVGPYHVELDPLSELWSPKNASSRMLAAALLAHHPLRPADQQRQLFEDEADSEGDEDLKNAATLGQHFRDVAGRARSPLAGRVLLAPSTELTDLAAASAEVLDSHLISAAARDALAELLTSPDDKARAAAAERFDQLRAPPLRAWVERFLHAQCEPDADDRVSIRALISMQSGTKVAP